MRIILTILAQCWLLLTVPLVFLLVTTPAVLLAVPFPLKTRLKLVGPFWWFFARYVIKYACFCRLYEEDHRPAHMRSQPLQGLYIANHQSSLDIPLLISQYQVLPIMKREVLYVPVLGLMAWASGALVVSRGKRDSRKKVFVQARHRLVDEKYSVQYYPEGTRSKTGLPKPYDQLKVPLLHLAWEAGVHVVPVSMYGTKAVLAGGLVRPGLPVGVITHAPLFPKDYPNANAFARACWAKVVEGHDSLKERLGGPPQS